MLIFELLCREEERNVWALLMWDPPSLFLVHGIESFVAVVGWHEEQWNQKSLQKKSSGLPLGMQPFLEYLLKPWETWIKLFAAKLLGLGHSLQPTIHYQLLPHQVKCSVLGSFGVRVVGIFLVVCFVFLFCFVNQSPVASTPPTFAVQIFSFFTSLGATRPYRSGRYKDSSWKSCPGGLHL